MKARARLDGLDDEAPEDRQRPALQKAMKAYTEFSRFVASSLRGLSRDQSWGRYCDSIVDAIAAAIDDTRARLQLLDEDDG